MNSKYFEFEEDFINDLYKLVDKIVNDNNFTIDFQHFLAISRLADEWRRKNKQ